MTDIKKRKRLRGLKLVAKKLGSGILDVLPIPARSGIKAAKNVVQNKEPFKSISETRQYLELIRFMSSIIFVSVIVVSVQLDLIDVSKAKEMLSSIFTKLLELL